MEHKRKQKKEQSPAASALIGGGVGLAVTLILHLILPLILLMVSDPNSLTGAASVAAMAVGGFAGALVAAYFCPSAKLQAGALSGPIAFLPLVLLSVILPNSINAFSLLIGAVAYCGGAGGATFLAVRPQSKRKKMKHLTKRSAR